MLTLGPLEPEAAVQMLSTTITADTSTSGSGRTSRPSQGGSGPGQRQGGPAGAGNREMLQQVAEVRRSDFHCCVPVHGEARLSHAWS